MTQVAAICKSLLSGQILSIMNGFQLFSCTNLPRELSRSVEQKFGVEISREQVEFTSKYGHKGIYYRYRLNRTDYNKEGIEKMKAYVAEQTKDAAPSIKATKLIQRPAKYKINEISKPEYIQQNLL